ncbi:MAG TPA: hypothetical protein DD706_13235 [Nitrospiraceae bacterium]|nr:hypothetical protein [Nitrospiraceae bacterium]
MSGPTKASERLSLSHGVCGVFLSISLRGLTDCALASDPPVPLQVISGQLTGRLNQVTLRIVFDQLHEQLGLDYVAPHAELVKVISVTLKKESVPGALSTKILARWDYAFTLDAGGNVTALHRMALEVPNTDIMVFSQGRESHDPTDLVFAREEGVGPGLGRSPEDESSKNVPLSSMPIRKGTRGSRRVFASHDPSMIRPPAPASLCQSCPRIPRACKFLVQILSK